MEPEILCAICNKPISSSEIAYTENVEPVHDVCLSESITRSDEALTKASLK